MLSSMDSSVLRWRYLLSEKECSILVVSHEAPLSIFRIKRGLGERGAEGTAETIAGKRCKTIEGIPGSEVRGIPDAPSGELLSTRRAGVGAVGSYQSCDQDGKVQDAKDRFEDRKGTCLRRDRGNSSSAERSHGAETVVDEIEAVGNVMKVSARIQIKGAWLERGYHSVDAGKSEAHQQIKAEGSKDGFRCWLFRSQHVAENNHDNHDVKNKGQGNVEYVK